MKITINFKKKDKIFAILHTIRIVQLVKSDLSPSKGRHKLLILPSYIISAPLQIIIREHPKGRKMINNLVSAIRLKNIRLKFGSGESRKGAWKKCVKMAFSPEFLNARAKKSH